MITETRKKIIELIEPYMDKTLNDGCLVEYGEFSEIVVLGQYQIKGDKVSRIYCPDDCGELGDVIGHYDITSVLKYISKNNGNPIYQISDEVGDVIYGSSGKNYKGYQSEIIIYYRELDDGYETEMEKMQSIGEIPNKSLILYTEQEDKDLLELLLKLK